NPDVAVDDVRQQVDGLQLIVNRPAGLLVLPPDRIVRTIPEWMANDFHGIVEHAGHFYIAASATDADTRVVAYAALDGDALRDLTTGDVATTIVPLTDLEGSEKDADVRIDLASGKSFLRRNGVETPLETSTASAHPVRRFPDKTLAWMQPLNIQSMSGRSINAVLLLTSTRAALFFRLFSSLGPAAMIVAIILAAFAVTLLVVEIGALTWSIRLTRSITHSVHELYEATRQVA